jgi:thiol-disulfide isomerase/thioredoxin
MNVFKKLLPFFVIGAFVCTNVLPVFGQEIDPNIVPETASPEIDVIRAELQEVNLYFFYGDGCPHCADEEVFLEELETRYENLHIYDFEVWKDAENRELLKNVGATLDVDIQGVPLTVVANQAIVGFLSEETTGADIEKVVQYAQENEVEDLIAPVMIEHGVEITHVQETGALVECEDLECESTDEIVLPVFGTINPSTISLPVLTVMIGVLDGFNPCAMWVLLFLISLLVNMKDKKRMWILGTVFIVASGSVYFVFMSAWLNFLLFVGFLVWVRLLIGGVAIASGAYNIREYFTNKEGECKVAGSEKRQKTFAKLRTYVHDQRFWFALGGIILLAFAVNLVELVCSAGFPAVYTQVLTMSDLPTWQYYGYLLLYILFFMIDDLFVFVVSMFALQITGVTTKYTRISNMVGGILMLALGAILILKPELLMFG